MQPTRLNYLLSKYLSNTLTPSERLEWLNYINDENNTETLRQLVDGVLLTEVPANEQSPEKAENIVSSILANKGSIPLQPRRNLSPIKRWVAAASILLLAGLTTILLNKHQITPIAASPTSIDSLIRSVAQKRKYIVLEDGSRVVLNQHSTLSHPNSFLNNKTREVYLTGEGYFDISHDDHKPFIVHTGNLTITVLGTAFNIKAYKDQPNITVTVTQGKVRVDDDQHSIGIITPNQQITVNAGSGEIKQHDVNAVAVTEWQHKELVFDDMPLSEVAVALQMKFDVPVTFDDPSLKDFRITASFINNEPLDQVLEVITKVNKIRYQMQDGHVVISRGNQTN